MSSTTNLNNLDNQVAQFGATGAVALPIGSNIQRPKNPSTGMLRWNSTTNALELYGPTAWNSMLNKQEIEDRFVQIASPKFTGELDAGGNKLGNIAAPTVNGDAVSLGYLEQRFTAGTGINSDTLDGHDSLYFATQYDVTDLQNLVAQVQTNLNTHIADVDNPHQTTKAQVGLDQADNTSDLDKPISTATQTALNAKVNKAGDTMSGALSMGYNNLMDIMNFVGSVWYFVRENPPAGFLVCNGAAVSRTNYSRLFSIIGTRFGEGDGTTTFNLPDLRGMFIRGWANSSYPTDPGRVLGSYQADMFAAHNHPGSETSQDGAHRHRVQGDHATSPGDGFPGEIGNANSGYSFYTDVDGAHKHTVAVGVEGGAETRPKNVALLPCIMY